MDKEKIINTIEHLISEAYSTALDKGFWDEERSIGETIALIHSELSEALEYARQGTVQDDKIPEFLGLEAELADVLIRVFDMAGAYNLNLANALLAKLEYNKTRPRKHGKLF